MESRTSFFSEIKETVSEMDSKISRVTFSPSTITGLSSHTGRHIQGLCFILKGIMVCALTHIKEPFILSPLLLRSLCFPLFRRTYYASASSMRVQFGRCRGIMTNQRCSGSTFHFGFASISVIPPQFRVHAPPSQQGQGFISRIFSRRRR